MAHARGILLVVDNCFCTPILQRPLDLGADLVVHSATKFLDGQGRVLGGAVCGAKKLTEEVLKFLRTAGPTLSAFNAWVLLKGLETLKIRLEAESAGALQLARWLEAHPKVARVYYPGLESHLHHKVAASQLARPDSGFGGVLSFGLDTDHDGHNRFVSKLNVITSAVSLGHDESLIVFLGEDDERQYLYPPEFHRGFFRLAVGLEDTDDLIRDIDHALVEAGFEV